MKIDYSKYTLEELYQVLEHIDDREYPERVSAINKRIAEIENSDEFLKEESNQKLTEIIKINKFSKYFELLTNRSYFLAIVSTFLGFSFLLKYFFGINFISLSLNVTYYYPWINQETNGVLFVNVILIMIYSGLFLGGIGHLFKLKNSEIGLIFSWSLLAIGIQVWQFMWFPTVSFDQGFKLDFPIIVDFGFQINFVSLFLLQWSMLLNKKMRKKFFKL